MSDNKTRDPAYCSNCGEELSRESQFCSSCGLEQTTKPQSQEETERANTPKSREQQVQGQPTSTTSSSSQGFLTQIPGLQGSDKGYQFVIIGGVIGAIGAFLPWFSVEILGSTATVNGIERDGVFTLVFSVAAVVIAYRSGKGDWGRKARIGVLILGSLIAIVGLLYINDPWIGAEPPSSEAQSLVSTGIGLYMTALGGVMAAVGAYLK